MNEVLLLLPVDVGQHVPAARHGAGDQQAVATVLGPEGQVVGVPGDRHELRKPSSVRADHRIGSRLQKPIEAMGP